MGSLFNPVITAIGNPIAAATQGSVLFAGVGGVLQQDNANFFWDDANNRLGIGNAAPTEKLDVTGNGVFSGNVTAAAHIPTSAAVPVNGMYLSAANRVAVATNTTFRAAFTAAGNLLIGTAVETAGAGLIQLATGTTAASGIVAGTDTNLYRTGAAKWRTDGELYVNSGAPGNGLTTNKIILDSGAGICVITFSGALSLSPNNIENVRILDDAGGSTRYLIFKGSNGANPSITTSAGSLAITPNIVAAGTLTTIGGTYLHATSTALTDVAAAQNATLTNGPVAGNPTKWIQINDNGTPRSIPTW